MITKKFLFRILFVLGILCFLISCIKRKDFDFDRLSSGLEIEPSFIFPLLHASLTMEDMVSLSDINEGQTIISYLDDGLVSFNYYDTMTSYIDYPGNPHDTWVLIPVEGNINVSVFNENSSYDEVDLYLEKATFETITTANVTIRSCEAKGIQLIIYDKENNFVEINLADISFDILKGVPSVINKWDISEKFYRIVPSRIHYSFALVYDAKNVEGLDSDVIVNNVKGIVNFPLYGYLGGVSLSDTLAFRQNFDDIPDIDSLNLYLTFRNNFPFSMFCQIYFLDENYFVKDSLFTARTYIEAAPVVGEVSVGETETNRMVSFNPIRAEMFKSVRYALISAGFKTFGIEMDQKVKIFKDNYFDVGMVVEVKEKINLNDTF